MIMRKLISAALVGLAIISMAPPVYAYDPHSFWGQQERNLP